MTWQPWRQAMMMALYGPGGFYHRDAGPAAHFRTSVHASPLFAEALIRLAHEVAASVDDPADFAVVDVGAGRGELLSQLAVLAPAEWQLVGVDVVQRPPGLPERVSWEPGASHLEQVPYGLLIANEWLDNVPVDVVQDGRLVDVDDVTGVERPAGEPSPADRAWCERWLPGARRAEVGRSRDEAWSAVLSRLEVGVGLAIDYRLDPARHRDGTLTGYRDGHQVPPVPDGSCDLTSHVLLESCAARAGGDALLLDQRTALAALGVSAVRPPRELASSDPTGYLQGLARAGEAAELTDPQGLGGFGWLVQPRQLDLPAIFGQLGG